MYSKQRNALSGRGLVALAGLLMTAAPVLGQDLSSADREILYQRVKPAVVYVQAPIEANITVPIDGTVYNWQAGMTSSGSGFLISPDGYVVTNGHVIELYHADNEDQLKAELFFSAMVTNLGPILAGELGRQPTQPELIEMFVNLWPNAEVQLAKSLQVYTQNWREYPADVREFSPPISQFPGKFSNPNYQFTSGRDVAILKIDAQNLPSVGLGDYDQVRMGQDVYPAGYPGTVLSHSTLGDASRLEITINRGAVSSLKTTTSGGSVMQMDADIAHGNSGGPVFNERGQVVAMSTFGSLIESSTGGQLLAPGLNFAVPISTISEFIRAEGVSPNRTGLFNEAWDRAIDAYAIQDGPAAIAALSEVLEIMPNLPVAEQLRLTARQFAPIDPGLPGWVLPVGGIVGVGALLLFAGARMNRKPKLATATVSNAASAATAVGASAAPQALGSGGTLVVREGPLEGNRFPVGQNGVKIGRDPSSCQIVLNSSSVSREHAIVAHANGDLSIRNLSGTNPTYVNDRAIQESQLRAGDRIKIGDSVIQFENS